MKISRRAFIKTSSAVAVASAFSRVAQANASITPDDYKALVVVFLNGGNDAFNTVLPAPGTAEWKAYRKVRGTVALGRKEIFNSQCKGIYPSSSGSVLSLDDLYLNKHLVALKPYFKKGDASIILNSGPLIQPTDRNNYDYVAKPKQLHSHNSQRKYWYHGMDVVNKNGWIGRILDNFDLEGSSARALSPSFGIPSINALRGDRYNPIAYKASTKSSEVGVKQNQLEGYKGADRLKESYEEHLNKRKRHYSNLYSRTVSESMRDSEFNNARLKELTGDYSDPDDLEYDDSDMIANFESVIALMKANRENAKGDLGYERQVFFINMGGFDTHGNMKERHPELLTTLAEGLDYFLKKLEDENLMKNVVTTTMSDFGRRLSPNDNGTDHGWGGHQLVFTHRDNFMYPNTAVGVWPEVGKKGRNVTDTQRVIPTVCSDQVNATVSRWLGCNEEQLNTVFPELKNFDDVMIEGSEFTFDELVVPRPEVAYTDDGGETMTEPHPLYWDFLKS
ncbi:DUF1501 domain-containing protein [Veronia pacifica]|uniref:Tat pathway signal protein n=1 Tax=Veronia pacifica TaxID=1080227 RepID=A0A1C3EMN5_9GAMM|nr:DUF1501 domain-containing protein [Veronia pacifica]ODA34498.1 hypothetical protein A8L45_05875 [Veronia pacifica]